jgi:alpha-ketoglutarate-dependent taurine dioxygenase
MRLATVKRLIDEARNGCILFSSGSVDPEVLIRHKLELKLTESNDGYHSIVKDAQEASDDFSKTSHSFDFHVDGLYLEPVPSVVILACVEGGDQGIKTCFLDSRIIAKKLISEFGQGICDEFLVNYVGRGNSVYQKDLLFTHGVTHEICMRWGSRIFLSPNVRTLQLSQIPSIRRIHLVQDFILCSIRDLPKQVCEWEAGKIAVIDNHAFLHSRVSQSRDYNREINRFFFE